MKELKLFILKNLQDVKEELQECEEFEQYEGARDQKCYIIIYEEILRKIREIEKEQKNNVKR